MVGLEGTLKIIQSQGTLFIRNGLLHLPELQRSHQAPRDGRIPSFANLGIASFDPKVFSSVQVQLFYNFQFLSQAMQTFMDRFKPKHQENLLFIYLSERVKFVLCHQHLGIRTTLGNPFVP